MAHLRQAELTVEALDLLVDGVLPSSLLEHGPKLCPGQLRRSLRGRGCGQESPGYGVEDALAPVTDGGQEAGEVLAQVRGQLVAGLGPVPDRVLLSAGEDGNGLGQLGVGRKRAVGCGISAENVRQHHGVQVVGLLAGDRVSIPITGRCHRVDGVDTATCRPQAGDQKTTRGLDSHRDGFLRVVALFGEDPQQLVEPLRGVIDASPGQQRARFIHDGYVVMVAGPVDAAECFHSPHAFSLDLGSGWSQPCRACVSLMEGLGGPTSD